MMNKRKKTILGFKGSPHSIAAASLLKSQNIELISVHFRFDEVFLNETHHALFPKLKCTELLPVSEIEKIARKCNLDLKIVDLSGELIYSILDPLVESHLTTSYLNPCDLFYNKIILKNLNILKEKLHADDIATGHQKGYPLSEIPEHLILKILEKINLPAEYLLKKQNEHLPDDCVPTQFWKEEEFSHILPEDLKIFQYNALKKRWNKKTDPQNNPKSIEALYLNEDESDHFPSELLSEFSNDKEFTLERDRRKNGSQHSYRVKIFPYLKTHVSIEFIDDFSDLLPGESFTFNKEFHPHLKGSFIIKD